MYSGERHRFKFGRSDLEAQNLKGKKILKRDWNKRKTTSCKFYVTDFQSQENAIKRTKSQEIGSWPLNCFIFFNPHSGSLLSKKMSF